MEFPAGTPRDTEMPVPLGIAVGQTECAYCTCPDGIMMESQDVEWIYNFKRMMTELSPSSALMEPVPEIWQTAESLLSGRHHSKAPDHCLGAKCCWTTMQYVPNYSEAENRPCTQVGKVVLMAERK